MCIFYPNKEKKTVVRAFICGVFISYYLFLCPWNILMAVNKRDDWVHKTFHFTFSVYTPRLQYEKSNVISSVFVFKVDLKCHVIVISVTIIGGVYFA